jgi:murein DD-endopeptidase MepM/ murein hydrolase activator NlpD
MPGPDRTVIRAIVVAVALASAASAAVELSTGRAVNDDACSITAPASSFSAEDPGVFVRAVFSGVHPADRIAIGWIDPSGQLTGETAYGDWPAAPRPCLISRLPVAGFAPAHHPGAWKVRVVVNGIVRAERSFSITNAADTAGSTIASVTPHSEGGRMDIELTGSGFRADSVVHVARFTEAGGWQYLSAEMPYEVTGTHCRVHTPALEPGEYVAVIRESNGAVTLPARFVLSTGRSYQFPVSAGEKAQITQGPNGGFSHWNRSSHAWDIVPQNGRYVAAMRAGIVRTRDLGLRQTPRVRSFGNYITIDHGDGEYSHYAHLAAGTFLVHDGERVEAGQELAVVGNSGYTVGPGGGYHVHVHITREPAISAQSIPFRFDEERPAAVAAIEPAHPLRATVQVAGWWTDIVNVPSRTALLRVRIERDKPDTGVDLHLVSPSGIHFGPDPAEFQVSDPEAGPWRISVEGMRSGPEPIAFRIERELKAVSSLRTQNRGRPRGLPR